MANKLEKIPVLLTGAGTVTGGVYDVINVPPDGSLPPQGSPCYADVYSKVAELWPYHNITYVKPDKGPTYFRVAEFGNGYVWRVVGVCKDGHIEVRYTLLRSPGAGSS